MLLREAIRTFDLETYLHSHGVETARKHEYVLSCPSCGKPKLTVNLRRKTWHCWVCERYEVGSDGKKRPVEGAGGLIDLVAALEGCDRQRAIQKVLAGGAFQHYETGNLPPAEMRFEVLSGYRTPTPIPGPPGWKPITGILPYMLRRGITMEDVRMFGLGWCDSGRYANRLVFPVWERGQFVYYQARAMWDPRPGEHFAKALNPPDSEGAAISTEVLMNLDLARQYPRVALVEGPMDCVRAGPDSVCTFGKKISSIQVAKLLAAGVKALDVMWDADATEEAKAVAAMLAPLFDTRVITLASGDPADHTRDQLNWLRQQSDLRQGSLLTI